jgi:hypothetical protein
MSVFDARYAQNLWEKRLSPFFGAHIVAGDISDCSVVVGQEGIPCRVRVAGRYYIDVYLSFSFPYGVVSPAKFRVGGVVGANHNTVLYTALNAPKQLLLTTQNADSFLRAGNTARLLMLYLKTKF